MIVSISWISINDVNFSKNVVTVFEFEIYCNDIFHNTFLFPLNVCSICLHQNVKFYYLVTCLFILLSQFYQRFVNIINQYYEKQLLTSSPFF